MRHHGLPTVTIIGAGLAGCEAALQCAGQGISVRLLEMRPLIMTPAHTTGEPAELVCSNSLKSELISNAHGLLKAELRTCGSLLLRCAEQSRIPGGKALVVDRGQFSLQVRQALTQAGVQLVRSEARQIPEGITVIATGPLTSPPLAASLIQLLGAQQLFFYDAIAPIVAADSIDMSQVFPGTRYGTGADYLNCALTESEYDRLVAELVNAELHPAHEFDKTSFFEGCLPVEEMARRGRLTLAFGPLKPVGLTVPDRQRPFAVVQLRRENAAGTMFNLVGFQTRLKHTEQERVFRLIPGLKRAVFLRYGSVHRNTYLNSPEVLLPTLQTRVRQDLFVAGQLTGVEGYVESIASGLVAGINAARLAAGRPLLCWPQETMVGALLRYITSPHPAFQPMNANFGLLPGLDCRAGRRRARQLQVQTALAAAEQHSQALAWGKKDGQPTERRD